MFKNKETFKREFTDRIIEKYGRDPKDCHLLECYDILGTMFVIMQMLILNIVKT